MANQEPKAIAAIITSLGMLVLERGFFPEECLLGILAVIKDPRFRKLRGSWTLLRVFEENWDYLTENQRSQLLPALEASYESHQNFKGCFLISEILGELYADDRAFETLTRLKSVREEMPRSLVPHGFEHIVLKRSNDHLAQRALAALRTMEQDESAMVRQEVKDSLARISKMQTSRGSGKS